MTTVLVGIGMDISGIDGWRRRLARTPAVERTAFTAAERSWCRKDPVRLAIVWAAKEAVVKALGCGFDGMGWHEVSLDFGSNPPRLTLPTPRPGLPDWAGFSGLRWFLHLGRLRTGRLRAAVVALVLALEPEPMPGQRGASGGTRAEVAITPVHEQGREATRTTVAAAERAASRRAFREAARRLLPGRASSGVEMRNGPGGRPVFSVAGTAREDVLVSMSHCSGWAGAVIGTSALLEQTREANDGF